MEEGSVLALTRPSLPPPKIVVPPRNPNEGFIRGGLNSATPTPMAFFSSLFTDLDSCGGSKPFLNLLAEALGSPAFTPKAFCDNFVNIGTDSMDMPADGNADQKPEGIESNEKGLSQKDLQSKNSVGYRAMMPSRLPITSSSMHFTVPPGLSPASLLESPPILFNTRQVDPSPTTGSLSLQQSALGRQPWTNVTGGEYRSGHIDHNEGFIFKPYAHAVECESPVHISIGTSEMQSEQIADGCVQGQEADVLCSFQRHDLSSDISAGVVDPEDHYELENSISLAQKSSGILHSSNARLSVDDYNWKKYGEKQLKNCEDSRGYYKCTHPQCTAKRLVERSQVGKITKIMYKGEHNHAKPQCARRRARSASLTVDDPQGALHDSCVQNSNAAYDINHDNNSGDLVSKRMLPHGGALPETPELSFMSPSNEDDDFDEVSITHDDAENDHDYKRRRIENEQEKPPRAVREPKVVIQTVSDVDVLDDGYRWRKYGQKVVKGHCFPRNYYRCSNRGCLVKKHAERSSFDAKSVITTYEGKHNHGVPAARSASRVANVSAGVQSLVPTYTDA